MRFVPTLINYSVVASIIIIISSYIIFTMGLYNTILYHTGIVFLILWVCLAIKKYIKDTKKNSILNNTFLGGLIGLISGSMFAIWFYFYTVYLNKDFMFNSIKTTKLYDELKAEGLNEEEINKTIQNMAEIISIDLQNAITIISYTTVGIFSAFAFSLLMKKYIHRLIIK